MTQHRLTSKAVMISTITQHPVKYCKTESGLHRADLILKAGRWHLRSIATKKNPRSPGRDVHVSTPLL